MSRLDLTPYIAPEQATRVYTILTRARDAAHRRITTQGIADLSHYATVRRWERYADDLRKQIRTIEKRAQERARAGEPVRVPRTVKLRKELTEHLKKKPKLQRKGRPRTTLPRESLMEKALLLILAERACQGLTPQEEEIIIERVVAVTFHSRAAPVLDYHSVKAVMA